MPQDKASIAIVLAFAAVALLAWGFMSGSIGYSAGATGGTVISSGASVCPTDLQTQVGVYAVESILKTTGEEQVVNDGGVAYVYRNGDTQIYDTLTLTGDGTYVMSTTGKELECGRDTFRLIVGGPENRSGGGYYYTATEEFQASRATENVKMTLDEIGTVKVNASNATAFMQVGAGAEFEQDITAGATNTDVVLTISETAGGVYRRPILCIDYFTSIFQTVEPTLAGASKVAVPVNMTGYEACYDLGVDKLADYSKLEVPMKLVVKSGATVAGAHLNISVMDKGSYITDGKLIDAYEDLDNLGVGGLDGDGSGSAKVVKLYYK